MQLPTVLLKAIKSGKVTLSQNDVLKIEVRAQDKRIEINALDDQIIDELISIALESSTKGSAISIDGALETLPIIKEISEDLCKQGLTLTISFKGDKMATIGYDANSKDSNIFTGIKE